jgi:cytochrome P450
MALEPLTFKDGLHVPAGTRVAWATHARVHDPEVTPNPDAFDPMRSYRKRHQDPSGMALTGHQAVTITKDHIGFGHGVQACPGRFLAVNQMKTILMRLLIECELQYPEGKSRPRSIYMEENAFPDPSATLMIRRKVAK